MRVSFVRVLFPIRDHSRPHSCSGGGHRQPWATTGGASPCESAGRAASAAQAAAEGTRGGAAPPALHPRQGATQAALLRAPTTTLLTCLPSVLPSDCAASPKSPIMWSSCGGRSAAGGVLCVWCGEQMIGPGGYADLEMDDMALEGAPAPAAPLVHWSQQQVGHVGGTAPLAPVVGLGGYTGMRVWRAEVLWRLV